MRNIVFLVTRRCNQTCEFCCEGGNLDWADPSTETLMQRLALCKQLGTESVTIQGGEPLLRSDIPALVNWCKSLGFYVKLVTNGTLVDASLVRGLQRGGLDKLHVSLHGTREVHDLICGSGSFVAGVEAVRHAVAAGIVTEVLTMGHSRNIGGIVPLARILADEGISAHWILQFSAIGRASGRVDQCPSAEAWLRLEKELLGLIEALGFPFTLHFERGLSSWGEDLGAGLGDRCQVGPGGPGVVDSDGTVYGCCLLLGQREFSVGQLDADSPADIMAALRGLSAQQDLPESCRQCEMLPVCGGGCPAYTWQTGRDYRCDRGRYIPSCPLVLKSHRAPSCQKQVPRG